MKTTLHSKWIKAIQENTKGILSLVFVFLLASSLQAQTTKTLTILGGLGNKGDIDPYTEASRDGGATWSAAFLTGYHPWGYAPGTNSWVNFDPSDQVGLNSSTDYRIRFNVPADFTDPQMSFTIKADNYATVTINGVLAVAEFAGQSTSAADQVIAQAVKAGLNEITIRLRDTGGLVGLNYRIDLSMISSEEPTTYNATSYPDNTPPTAIAKDITIYLDDSGSATITPEQVDNGSSDNSGSLTLSLDKTSFDCSDISTGFSTDNIYFGDNKFVAAYNVVTGVRTNLLTAPTAVNGVAFDEATQQVFWTEHAGGKIYRANANGSGITVLKSGLFQLTDISIDPDTQTIYWSGRDNFTFGSIKYDGTDYLSYQAPWTKPYGISLDRANNRIFWGCYVDGKIGTANYDGTAINIDFITGQPGPRTVSYDQANDTYYFTTGSDIRKQVGATGTPVVISSGYQNLGGIVYDKGTDKLFFININGLSRLNSINTDGSGFTELINGLIYSTFLHAGEKASANGNVTLTATDVNNNSASATAAIKVVDAIAPTITLNGNATETVEAYTSYTDAGATATDNCSAPEVTVGGAVDINTPGVYKLTYDASDASGNAATQVSRTVTVVDNTPPTVVTKDITVYLDANGNASVTPQQVDNGSSDASGTVTLSLDKTTFDCNDLTIQGGPSAQGYFYYRSGSQQFSEGNISNGSLTNLFNPNASTWSVDYDEVNDKVFYVDGNAHTLIRANKDGTNKTVIASGLGIAYGLTLDVDNQLVYLVEVTGAKRVLKISYDGTTQTTLATNSYGSSSIVLDKANNDLYFANWAGNGKIGTVKTDGSGHNESYVNTGTSSLFGGVYYMSSTNTLYWSVFNSTNAGSLMKKVGSNSPAVAFSGYSSLFGFDIDEANSQVYFVNYGSQQIVRSDLDGTNSTILVSGLGGYTYQVSLSNTSTGSSGTSVTLTATDANNNSASATAIVTVVDLIAPAIIVPEDISVFATSELGAVVNYETPVGTDNCSVTTEMTSGFADGATFPIGTTEVTYTATDASGNSASGTFQVAVTGIAPEIVSPGDITANTDAGLCGAIVGFEATETTAIPASTITYTVEPGSFFETGTTSVTATAVNAVGSSSITFDVVVVDNEFPLVQVPASINQMNDAGVCGATINIGLATATDNCSVVSLVSDAPEFFEEGTTIVTWTAIDASGNETTAQQTVVVYNVAPVLNTMDVSELVMVGETVVASATFTDNNVVNATWYWGDGSSTEGVVTGESVTGDYVYSSGNLYDVRLVIEDACGLTSEMTYSYVVSYDPCAGHITGGGYIDSYAGAYTLGSQSDKAQFEFNGKYHENGELKGKFKFKLGSKKDKFEFKSETMDWLVVNEDQAIFSGVGKVKEDESSSYTYLVSIIDGDVVQKHDPDYIRVIIWDAYGNVVYENQSGDTHVSRALQQIEKGSIKIHKGCGEDDDDGSQDDDDDDKKKDKNKLNPIADSENFDMTIFPNPVSNEINMHFNTVTSGMKTVEIYDLTGRAYLIQEDIESFGGLIKLNVSDLGLSRGNYLIRVKKQDSDEQVTKIFKKD